MRRVLLMGLVFLMWCGFSSSVCAQQPPPSNESSLAARTRELEKTVQAQKLRIRRLEQQLRTREEEVHMLVKIVSKQSDKDSKDATDEGNTGADSSACEPNPVVRARDTRGAHLKTAHGPAR
jgi:TolA-binding protein